ncbi:helix-turn-helix domain-containing protein [Pectobacterium brasiliense]|uniref:Helix-turn-helix transcriptional regulator n=1 Tax=Pectobacterium brasiliense TaxID=180957 RepID=A0AAE3BES9_9GAMM|nr:helix-turn-helix transcriptional regulator [Pectobacterium brasiliense]APS30906.1 DNA-binding protein [Pectobacterium brasiliense]KHT02680.1 DNA-binding protein [Pectobacterium brasiliense]MBN3052237.1 helix-turn-helix transcriptional regulator [Pectobacterium brasiliense]MBN3103283.1 helix-turn-helix transcriptional regulator [Pectobacterium brasiliense]MBN3180555.1 helix-turn-helix transcriptional regulator [Pectobacterium brasiliense]
MNIGQAIKLCRTRRGISQTDLANKAECSVSYLSMLENNKRDPTLSTLTKIATALKLPVSIIFFIAAETGDLNGMDKGLQGELARTALELLNESSPV